VPDATVLAVTVIARQRLALGVGSEVSYFTGTHLYAPGSVIRGALAAAWIAENGPPDRADPAKRMEFRDLFDGAIRFGPLYMQGSDRVPISAWLCKYPTTGECQQMAVDRAFESGSTCPACDGPLEQGKGDVLLPDGVSAERVMRTSIDRETGRAEDGELYAHGALPAQSRLVGTIFGRHPWLEAARPLRLGGRRTVGGAADYRAAPDALPDPPLVEGDRLLIRLASPGIFVDVAGRPVLAPDESMDLAGAQVEQRWARPVSWWGWHAASKLPKPIELCAEAGSTYQLEGDPDVLRTLAATIRSDGIGLRRTEGFGVAEVVAQPWRPPPRGDKHRAVAEPALALRDRVDALGLKDDQHRWLVGALRELQLTRADPGVPGRHDELLDALFERALSYQLSGRQREDIGAILSDADAQQLRDLTVLLATDRREGVRP
jgi:CRISPR-associated protein Csx10